LPARLDTVPVRIVLATLAALALHPDERLRAVAVEPFVERRRSSAGPRP
jgi:hypothetical protein